MEALYIEKHGHKPMGGERQLVTITAAYGALQKARQGKGLSFNSTNWIIGRAAGYPTCCPEGETPTWKHKREDLRKWGTQAVRIRRYLEELGLLEESHGIKGTRGYRCLRVTMSRLQPYATHRRFRRRSRRGSSSGTKLCNHSVERGESPSGSLPLSEKHWLDARERPRQPPPRTALVDWMAKQHIQEVELDELRRAGEDGVPPCEVLEEAFELLHHRPARLSYGKRLELDQACGTLDRWAHFGRGRRGAGVDQVIRFMEAEAEDVAAAHAANNSEAVLRGFKSPKPVSEPQSLAYFLPAVRQEARRWRRAVGRTRAERRQRRAETRRPRPSSGPSSPRSPREDSDG